MLVQELKAVAAELLIHADGVSPDSNECFHVSILVEMQDPTAGQMRIAISLVTALQTCNGKIKDFLH